MLSTVGLTWGLIYAQDSAKVQTPPPPPERIVLPWQFMDLNANEKQFFKNIIRLDQENLLKLFLDKPISFVSYLQTKEINIMSDQLKERLKELYVEEKENDSGSPIIISPLIAKWKNRYIIAIEFIDQKTLFVTMNRHKLIMNSEELKKQSKIGYSEYFSKQLTDLWQESASPTTLSNPPQPGLKIKLVTDKYHDRKDSIHPMILNLFLSNQLTNDNIAIIPNLNYELLKGFHWINPTWFKIPRPNQIWTFDWQIKKQDNKSLTMNILFKQTEAILGQQIAKRVFKDSKLEENLHENFKFVFPPAFTQVLEQTIKQSDPKKLPQVSKIYGAWAYLDKGRAWGLNLKDRVVISGQEQQIQGHIVKFFGPEEKIKSSVGTLINDGAIMYIRKGQRNIKMGQEVTFDLKNYPTPWPPN